MAGDEISDGENAHLDATPQLRRRLGVFDSVMIGLGSMIGAGSSPRWGLPRPPRAVHCSSGWPWPR